MKNLLALIGFLLFASTANAAVSSLNVTVPGSGTAFAFDTDGSSNKFPLSALYGIGGDYEADVDSTNHLFVSPGPDPTPTTGNISTADIGTTCGATPTFQTDCTGTATASSAVQATINHAGYIGVSASISGGTATVVLSLEVSQDGTNWYGRGLFLDSNAAPNWHNSLASPPFAGLTSGGGVAYYRIRASTFTVLTGSPVIAVTIRQGQQSAMQYIGNLPMSANGSPGIGSVNMQGSGTSALPVNMDMQQVANTTLGAPTAAGSSASGNILGIQGVTSGVPVPISGSVSATFAQFAPNGNYSTPLVVGAASANTALPSGGGSTIAVYNTGTAAAFVKLGTTSGVVATASDDQVAPGGFNCFAVGANTYIAGIETASATTLNISGGSGGCAGSGGGGGGGGAGGTADANLSLTGAISAANNASTGLVVGNYMSTGGLTGYASGGAELTGTATANSAISTSGFAGWNSIYVECTGLGTAGTNWFEVDTSGGTGGTLQKRQAAFTGPTFSGVVNASGATFLNIMADQYASGTPSCTARATQNFAAPNNANGPLIGNLSSAFSVASSTTTQFVTGVPGLSIVVTNFSSWTDGGAAASGTAQMVAGTGSNCGTNTTNIGASMSFAPGSGLVSSGAGGQQFTLPPGYALCVKNSTANLILGNFTIAMR